MNYKIVGSQREQQPRPISNQVSREFPRGDETFITVDHAFIDGDYIDFVAHGLIGPSLAPDMEVYLLIDEEIASEPLEVISSRVINNKLHIRTLRPQGTSTELGFNPQKEFVVLTTNGNLTTVSKRIRANYTDSTVVVYQAFSPTISRSAVAHQRFADGFDFDRGYTWIKPSFAWMMHRTKWLIKGTEQRILRINLDRAFFLELLEHAALTQFPESGIMTEAEHKMSLNTNKNRVQWDPERNLVAHKLHDWRSIQVGIFRDYLLRYNENIRSIEDVTEEAKFVRPLMQSDTSVSHLILPEYPFPTPDHLMQKLDMLEPL